MDTLRDISQKIVTVEQLQRILSECVAPKTVFTNGCFDILHLGHVEYLAKARDLGDLLVVGLNSDSSVRQLKGKTRPINPQYARAVRLAALEPVDFVVIFDEETPLRLIQRLEPHVLVKGGDYTISEIVGADEVMKNGGIVRIIPITEGFSTTNIVNQCQ